MADVVIKYTSQVQQLTGDMDKIVAKQQQQVAKYSEILAASQKADDGSIKSAKAIAAAQEKVIASEEKLISAKLKVSAIQQRAAAEQQKTAAVQQKEIEKTAKATSLAAERAVAVQKRTAEEAAKALIAASDKAAVVQKRNADEAAKAQIRSAKEVDAVRAFHAKHLEDHARQQDVLQKNLAESQKKAYDSSLVGRFNNGMASTVGRLATVAVAARVVGDAMQFVQQKTDDAVASFEKLKNTKRDFSQIATSATDIQEFSDKSKALAAAHGVDRETIQKVLVAARNEADQSPGLEKFASDIIKYEPIVEPTAAVSIAGQIPGLFSGSGLTGRQAVNMGLVASGQSRLQFEQLSRAIPAAAEGASTAGVSPDEALAVAGFMAGKFSTGMTAGDRLKGFGIKMSLPQTDPELRATKSYIGATEWLMKTTPEKREEFLKDSQELNALYSKMVENLDTLKQRTKDVAVGRQLSGTPQEELSKRLGYRFDPSTQEGRLAIAEREQKRQLQRQEIGNEEANAATGLAVKATVARVQADLSSRTGIERLYAEQAAYLAQKVTQSPTLTEAASRTAGFGGRISAIGFFGELEKLLSSSARDQQNAARDLSEAAANLNQRTKVLSEFDWSKTPSRRASNTPAARQAASMSQE